MTRHENGPRKPTARAAARKPPRQTAEANGPEVETVTLPGRQRIAKLMARVGLCSRRDAEAWIVDGRVTLNGVLLTSPAQDVGADDTILVDGMPLPQAEKTRLFLFHKPRGLVTSDHDPEGRQTVTDYLRETWPEGPRVVTVGRLDINTEGLLLLTNDGGLARVLELPATGWVRRYRVRAKGETDQGVLDRLREGVTIEGIAYAGIEAKLDRAQGANSWLTMGLREGKNREIKRVLEHIGLEVNRLIRLSFGPFQLLDLPEGKVEEVRTRVLRDQLGEGLAAEAGVDLPDETQVTAPPFRAETRVLSRGERPDRKAVGQDRAARGAPGTGPRDKSFGDKSFGDKSFGDKSSRGKTGGAFGDAPREGARRASRRDAPSEEAPVQRERPVAGTRKHVSAIRAAEADDLRTGPRKRIERTDTKDRKDRTVTVERLVTARPEPRARRGVGRFASREETFEGGPERAREPRQERATRNPGRAAGRDHASPSAMAKRVRIARSGGAEAPREPHAIPTRAPRGDRPTARGPTGGKERSVKPWADVPVAEERPVRHQRDERPARPRREDKPREGAGDRPRAARADGAAREERNAFPARSSAAKPRSGERPRAEGRPRSEAPGRAKARAAKAGDAKPRDFKPRDAKFRDGKPRGEKAPHTGAGRRVGERDAGERDARKAGKRPVPGRGGDGPRGPTRGPKGPPRGPTRGPRASKPRD